MIQDSIKPNILKCKDYVPGKPVEEVEREYGLKDILKMASNENPLGTSPLAKLAMIDEIMHSGNRYPESLCVELVSALAQKHNVKANQIVVGNGLDNIITMIGMTFLDADSEVVFGELTFPAYGNIARKMGAKCIEVPMNQGERLDLSGFANAVTDKTKILFVCNPNNPTGTYNNRCEVEKLIETVPKRVLIVFDEAYFEYTESSDYPDCSRYVATHDNVVALRTFSKIMGMGGIRVGYAIANEAVIRGMLKVREPFPVNRPAQAGALASLSDTVFVEKTLQVNVAGKKEFYERLEAMGVSYLPTETNFVYMDFHQSAADVFEKLLRKGVIIRPLGVQNRPTCARITIGTPEQNARTLDELEAALRK
ncbi:MAG: histidinol-phosphate transaminase [Clostridia bacterium]|nr:histidinol-phosphate transaminase [Candidatus Pelethousia sp.]NCB30100.1 histidinol-phosphate transaminase [Clostridia bacterium]